MKVLLQNGKFVRQKCYLEEIDRKMNITCAGMPKSCYSQVEWDKFKTRIYMWTENLLLNM